MSPELTDEILRKRSVALVSGKGGSGKTIVAAVMAEAIAAHGKVPVVIDADLGTAGLSFYLGLDLVKNTSRGLSNILVRKDDYLKGNEGIKSLLQPLQLGVEAYFLSAGDYRRYRNNLDQSLLIDIFKSVIFSLQDQDRLIIVDCRGGIDSESLAVCHAVDDIILIVETDTTSYQASQYLVEILGEYDLSQKLRGFIINKVFEDPRVIIRSGTALFHTQYLGSVPFDFDAMRDFFSGKIPSLSSLFGIHVEYAVAKAYPDWIEDPKGRIFSPTDYSEIGLSNPDSLRGGIVIAGLIVLLTTEFIFSLRTENSDLTRHFSMSIRIGILGLLGLFGSLNNTRKLFGRGINFYIKALTRILSKA